MHIDTLPLATPLIGEMLRRRFESCLKMNQGNNETNYQIKIQDKTINIKQHFAKEVLKHIHTAIDPQPSEGSKGRGELTEILNYVSNYNARFTLQLLTRALQSWALEWELIHVSRQEIKLLPFTTNQIVNLASLGQYELYEHNNHIYNIFAFNGFYPDAANGKFPILILYRIFQYFDLKGRKVFINTALNDLDIFGYSRLDIQHTLGALLKNGFLESPEGNDLQVIKMLYCTRKFDFYYDKLIMMFTYLTNIRNDSVIEYETIPHQISESISKDLLELYKFIWYIADQEKLEYQYTKKYNSQIKYENLLLNSLPVSWRLFRSINDWTAAVLNELSSESREPLFPLEEKSEIVTNIKWLFEQLVEFSNKKEVIPKLSVPEIARAKTVIDNLKLI